MKNVFRTAAAVPQLRLGDVRYNTGAVAALFRRAAEEGAAAVVFPELALTGYTCRDLFTQRTLLDGCREALETLLEATRETDTILIAGLPWEVGSRLFNAAAVVQRGRLLGIAAKSYLPNYREFYEKRQFRPAHEYDGCEVRFAGDVVPFGNRLVFESGAFSFGVELCEDLWAVRPPSEDLALAGARVIFNLSAGNELVAKSDYRRSLVQSTSARLIAGYVYAGSGVGESTSDALFSGDSMIAVNGSLRICGERFAQDDTLIFADINCRNLDMLRRVESSFNDAPAPREIVRVAAGPVPEADGRYLRLDPRPFVPADAARRHERCREILAIQSAALAQRMKLLNCRLVLGLSGGLDSTWALVAACEACKRLGDTPRRVLGVTMPGFGTTGRSFDQAGKLAALLGVELRTIPIKEAVNQHFADIAHDPANHNVVYENAQARERTQILMDLANAEKGIVLGTGDLSEIALGWNTFNGDQMAMYNINCSVPKSLVKHLTLEYAENASPEVAAVLRAVADMPYSPELLPGEQITENTVGSYDLHDFFLYHFLKFGTEPEELVELASQAFSGENVPRSEIVRCCRIFIRRFFAMQFKRNASPDGPKIGTVSLSQRADWRMPSDAANALWLDKLEKLR